jgi:hypothetical protein
MSKHVEVVINCFLEGKGPKKVNNTRTDGESLFLHENKIAWFNKDRSEVIITNCSWSTNTTKSRLNMLPFCNIKQKNYKWYINTVMDQDRLKFEEWDGKPYKIIL